MNSIPTHIHRLLMTVKNFLRSLRPYRFYLLLGGGTLIFGGVLMCLLPQNIAYNFGQLANCQTSPRLLPQLSNIEKKQPFTVRRSSGLTIGKLQLYSHRVCVSANAAPAAKATTIYKERIFGWPLLSRNINIMTARHPMLAKLPASITLPPDGTLAVGLDHPDATFTYIAKAGEHAAPCTISGTKLHCKLEPLQLTYAQDYRITLARQFNKKTVSEAGSAAIRTLTPVKVVATSIGPTANVLQKPNGLTILTDKKITAIGTPSLVIKNPDGSESAVPVTAHVSDTSVVISFGQELPRKAAFEARLSSVTAEDGSGLPGETFALAFTTSGGPKVTGVNIGARNVSTSQAISLSFDQPLLAGQDPAKLVNLTIGGKGHPLSMTVSGNKIILTPGSPLPLCALFTIRVNEHVQSQFGISGDSSWSINSRAICYTTFSIGSSVRGRGITAYQFGEGPNPVIYMGAMHGSEANSRTLMTEWFNELNANPGRLAARSLVIIPAVNPDGLASGSRLNANGVDLNRNFPAADWKSVVTSPDNPDPSPAGGPAPLSEPESRAVASYIQRVRPRMVFSFHSAAAVVEANEAGDSVGVASTYAAKARYRAVPKSQSAPVFKYDTTGAMEDWMRDRLGSPAIVVELLSKTSSEFSRNRDALWFTTGL